MKGQGRNDEAGIRSTNGPGKFIASKVRATSQVAVHASLVSNIQASAASTTLAATNNTNTKAAIVVNENSKLSEKDIQV